MRLDVQIIAERNEWRPQLARQGEAKQVSKHNLQKAIAFELRE
jgi:hypothetical protein